MVIWFHIPPSKNTHLVNAEAKLLLILRHTEFFSKSRPRNERHEEEVGCGGISEDDTFRQGDVWQGGGPNLSFAALGAV